MRTCIRPAMGPENIRVLRISPRARGLRRGGILGRTGDLRLYVFAVLYSLSIPQPASSQSVNRDVWVTDGTVNATDVRADTLYIGGSFTRVQPVTGGGVPLDLTIGAAATGFS